MNSCNADTAFEIRKTIFGLQKALETVKFAKEQTESSSTVCDAIPCTLVPGLGCSDLAKSLCKVPPAGLGFSFTTASFAAELALSIADRTYNERCEPNGAIWETNYQEIRQNAIYNNAITNGRNIITTFAATQQLKIMLGDVQAGLEADREERDDQGRRLQSDDCVDTPRGFLTAPCSEVTCQDPARLCDGSYNYPYISGLVTGKCTLFLIFILCISCVANNYLITLPISLLLFFQ